MACRRAVTFLALLCAVASAVEAKHPPQDYNDLYEHHGEHNPNFPLEDTKTNLAEEQNYNGLNNPNFPVHSEESRKFYKPLLFYPYFYHPHNPHPAPEIPESEVVDPSEATSTDGNETETPEEAQPYNQEVTDTEGNNEEQGLGEQGSETTADEVPFDEEEYIIKFKKSYEVPCDFLSVPRYSCYTCYTYLVCKPEGGKIKSCADSLEPYCNNGQCSATPSAECTLNSSALFY